jgi:hypothetical protein
MKNLKLPIWIIILSAVFALLEILVSFSIYFSPESVAENVDLKAKGVDYLMQTWAIRQFALGFIFAFATIKKSSAMLTIAYIFFLVMMLGDVWIGFMQKNNVLIIAASFMSLLCISMIFVLKKQSRESQKPSILSKN